jgi:hypothetical protein
MLDYQSDREKWLVRIAVIATLVAVGAMVASWSQVIVAEKARQDAKTVFEEQRDDAKGALALQRQDSASALDQQRQDAARTINTVQATAMTDQRAWMGIERIDGKFVVGGSSKAQVQFINAGRSPALDVHVAWEIDCEPESARPKILYSESTVEDRFVLVPGQHMTSDIVSDSVCAAEKTVLF